MMNAVARPPRRCVARAFLAIAIVSVVTVTLTSCASRVSYRALAEEYYNLGNAYFELGEYERSFQFYSRAVDLDETLPATGYNLARLHIQREEYDDALDLLEELIDNDPTNGLYRETLAYTLYRADRVSAARDRYRELIELYPARSRIRYNLAVLELEEERPAAARGILEAGLETAEGDEEYRWLLAEASYLDDDPETAARHLEVFRTLVEEEPDQLTRLAKRYSAWDFSLAALEVLSGVPDTVDSDPELRFLEARLYLTETSEFDRGLTLLEEALAAGFDDTEELKGLLDAVRAGDRSTVEAVIEAAGLVLDGPEAGVPGGETGL
ncbi:MAG: tetratricopeptide repeat protein [Alkalispirochaeta sp.]